MAEIFFEHVAELTETKRLHEVLVAPGFAGQCEKGRFSMAGDEDNRHAANVPEPAYQSRGVETVHARKAAVHQDQVRARALRESDGLLAVGGFDDAVASNLQHGAEQETRIIVVVRDEDERLTRWRRVPRVCCVLQVAQ